VILKEADAGMQVAGICHRHTISDATCHFKQNGVFIDSSQPGKPDKNALIEVSTAAWATKRHFVSQWQG
jgi:hypothetical protein